MYEKLRRDLDLRLLRILHLLLNEASVSRTAVLLGQSQPAVSASLRRLREITGDPLLVRSGSHLVPTERGESLKEVVGRILQDVDAILDGQSDFDPATSRRHIRIVASTCLGPFLLPRLVERLAGEAPHVELELSPRPPSDVLAQMLEAGEVDLVLGNWPQPAPNLRYAPLVECDIACMVRQDHPLAGTPHLSLDAYLALDHLSPTPLACAPWSPIDGRLEQLGLSRRVPLTIPEFGLIPYVLARTDHVFTTARPVAEHFASMMPFALIDAPQELGRMNFFMLWHERAHHAPFGRWLRSVLRKAAGEVNAKGRKVASLPLPEFIRAA